MVKRRTATKSRTRRATPKRPPAKRARARKEAAAPQRATSLAELLKPGGDGHI
jgi:hypothetical protein